MDENEYEGAWITTYTGKKFHFRNPSVDEVCIEDIAHHLSLLCRFTGAIKEFYSVAEHSIRVAGIVPKPLKLSALLHDAAEAYINDISRPVKYTHRLDKTEKAIMDVVAKKYKITPYAPEIKEADDILIATEARDLMPNTDAWAKLPQPLADKIHPFTSYEYVEHLFLIRFEVYHSNRGV